MNAKERAMDVVAYARHIIASRMIDQIRQRDQSGLNFYLSRDKAESIIAEALAEQDKEIERMREEIRMLKGEI